MVCSVLNVKLACIVRFIAIQMNKTRPDKRERKEKFRISNVYPEELPELLLLRVINSQTRMTADFNTE
jgi:hypothetical protein